MGGLAVGDAWLPTRTGGSLWLRGGIVKAGWPGRESTRQVADERASGGAWPGLLVGRFTQAGLCRAGGYLARLWRGDGWGFALPVGKDDPEAPERQLVSGISWVPTPFTGDQ